MATFARAEFGYLMQAGDTDIDGVAPALPSRGRTPDEIDAAIGLKLKALRNSHGWSMSELGRLVGLSYQQVQKYENGINRLTVSMLCHMASVLGVSPSDLLPDGPLQDRTIGPIAYDLAIHAERLPEAAQVRLVEFVKSLVDAEVPSSSADNASRYD